MKNFRFNYIITIHNKENLIRRVLQGLLECAKENSFIYPVLDGCTDNTEKIVDEVIAENPRIPIIKVYTSNVHELKTINAGLRAAKQDEKGCNIILQDDVIIQEPDLENIVYKIYEYFGYTNVGYLAFRHGVNIYLKDRPEISEIFRRKDQVIEERDLIESAYGMGMSPFPLPAYQAVERMAVVGSPQSWSCDIVNKMGLLDERQSPVGWACHDISLRCLEAGRHNYVFALKVSSEVEWGGTRTSPNLELGRIFYRNQRYLYQKHKKFLEKFQKSKEYRRLKLAKPFTIPGISVSKAEIDRAKKQYYFFRGKAIKPWVRFIAKYIKCPLKKLLIHLRLY